MMNFILKSAGTKNGKKMKSKSGNHKRCLHHHFFQHYSAKKLPKSFFIRIFALQTKETKRWKQRISTNWSQKT